MSRNPDTDRAWAWVVSHVADIDRAVSFATRGAGVDPDDVRSETVIRLVRRFGEFDPGRGSAWTWILWQARASTTNAIRARRKRLAESPLHDHRVTRCGGNGPHAGGRHPRAPQNSSRHTVDVPVRSLTVRPAGPAAVELRELRKRATDAEWVALMARAAGYGGAELAQICGCAEFSARRRADRFLSRLIC